MENRALDERSDAIDDVCHSSRLTLAALGITTALFVIDGAVTGRWDQALLAAQALALAVLTMKSLWSGPRVSGLCALKLAY